MEKLIELLNEYEQENLKVGLLADKWEFDGNLHYYSQYQDELIFTDVDLRIISARYGFIKWLVENDKIDLDKMEEKSEYTFLKKRGGEHIIEDVLMLLSISDTPIEDLISYLR